MGVRKRLINNPTCWSCDMPVEDKAYRVHSMGDGACMHLNCAYNYWQQYRKQRGYVPVCDINVEGDAVYDMILDRAAKSRCNLEQHEEVARQRK